MLNRIAAPLFLLAAMACTGSNGRPTTPASPTPTPAPVPTPSVSSVTVSGTAPTFGATAPFSATANLSNGTAQTVTGQSTWRSSNTSVASVTDAGLVTGIDVGDADITATYQGASGTSHVSVVRATYTVSGMVTDGTSGGVLPNININVDSGATTRSTLTNSAGNYSMSGVAAGLVLVTASAVSYQTTPKPVIVFSDTRVDFVLPRTSPGYAGIWTGRYGITQCQDIDGPGLTPLMLCSQMQRDIAYRFTLSQSGTTVTGAYTLTSPLFSCPCGGDYGTFDMSGEIASDGALVIAAAGVPRATGLEAAMTFNVRLATSATLTGTVSGDVKSGGFRRATFTGAIMSATR